MFSKIREEDLEEMVDMLAEALSCFELIEQVLPVNNDPRIDEARGVALQQMAALKKWRNDNL